MASLVDIDERISAIQLLDGNDACADCSKEEPTWASVTNGALICTACSGVHRLLGVDFSFVQSLKMDDWTGKEEELNQMLAVGNKIANSSLEYHVPSEYVKPVEDSSRELREKYIRAKYELKAFVKNDSDRAMRQAPVDDVPVLKEGEGDDPKAVGMKEYEGMLIVNIKFATKLPIADLNFSSDPYVVVECGGQTMKTKTVKKSLDPIFNEKLMLCVTGKDPISFTVMDWDRFNKDDKLGEAVIDAPTLKTVMETTAEFPQDFSLLVNEKKGSKLEIELQFQAIDH